MTIRDQIRRELKILSEVDNVVFIGENVINSNRIYGTLTDVPINKCIEMPVAENLITGCGIGLAIAKYIPIVIFQRMDFMLIAADQIINHASLIPEMTEVKIPIIFITFKATLNDKFYAGLQHTKDLSHVFKPYLVVREVCDWESISECFNHSFRFAREEQKPQLLVIDHERLDNEMSLEKGENG